MICSHVCSKTGDEDWLENDLKRVDQGTEWRNGQGVPISRFTADASLHG